MKLDHLRIGTRNYGAEIKISSQYGRSEKKNY
jgi:hypothetical protein